MEIYYHVSPVPDLTQLRPFKGQLFITDNSHVGFWATWVYHERCATGRPLYIYEVEVPDDVDIYIGADGEENGDYFVTVPLKVINVKTYRR